MVDKKLAYALLRITFGLNFLWHGLIRFINGIESFESGLIDGFSRTFLPEPLVVPYAYMIPVIEGLAGIFLILGLFTRHTLIGLFVLFFLLISGMCIQQQWDTVGIQMIYVIILYFLTSNLDHNYMALDARPPKN